MPPSCTCSTTYVCRGLAQDGDNLVLGVLSCDGTVLGCSRPQNNALDSVLGVWSQRPESWRWIRLPKFRDIRKWEFKRRLRMTFLQFISKFHQEESGQDLLEYALVLLAVLAAVVTGSQNLATDIATGLTAINVKIQAAIAKA